MRKKYEVYGISFNTIAEISSKLKISASNLSKQINKISTEESLDKKIKKYLDSFGAGFTHNGVTYPNLFLGLLNLNIPIKHYKLYISYTNDSLKEALDYFTSKDYMDSKLPIKFEDSYFNSLLDLCKEYKVIYNNVKTNSVRYNLSFKQGFIKELNEIKNNKKNKNLKNDETKYKIFNEYFPSKESALNHFRVSIKTISKVQREYSMEFEEALEWYINTKENGGFTKYTVGNKQFKTLSQVYAELNVTKSIFEKKKEKYKWTTEETISYFYQKSLANTSSRNESSKINLDTIRELSKILNRSLKETAEYLNKAQYTKVKFNSLTEYQKNVYSVLVNENLSIMITKLNKVSKIDLYDHKAKKIVQKSIYGLENIRLQTIENLMADKFIIEAERFNIQNNAVKLYVVSARRLGMLKIMDKVNQLGKNI